VITPSTALGTNQCLGMGEGGGVRGEPNHRVGGRCTRVLTSAQRGESGGYDNWGMDLGRENLKEQKFDWEK